MKAFPQSMGNVCQSPDDLDRLFDLLRFQFEPKDRILWCRHGDPSRPCYTPQLLSEMLRLFATIGRSWSSSDTATFPFHYLILGSNTPGVWNLGGDLALFVKLIRAGDTEGLRDYAHACVDAVFQNFDKGGFPYLTIALVQGDALGGGFETVLSHDIVIAEEHCQFGLPEILFNMFPSMGAYSFLSRRLGRRKAHDMILSGRLFTAQELYECGLVDLVLPTGQAETGLRNYLDRARRRQHRNLVSMSRVSRRCEGIDYAELIDIADIWVDHAMGISSQDLRFMERLVRAQNRKGDCSQAR